MSELELIPTCFDILDPPLYLSSVHLPQPYDDKDSFSTSLKIFRDLGIDGIINMSTDSPIRPHHRKFYKKNKIDFFEIPIEDSTSNLLNDDFLDQIVEIYQKKKEENNDYIFLIHCTMGVNRSAFAAGAILWANTSPKLTSKNRPWENPLEMIKWMKNCQLRDRNLRLLGNSYFEMNLRDWCRRQDGDTSYHVTRRSHLMTQYGEKG